MEVLQTLFENVLSFNTCEPKKKKQLIGNKMCANNKTLLKAWHTFCYFIVSQCEKTNRLRLKILISFVILIVIFAII